MSWVVRKMFFLNQTIRTLPVDCDLNVPFHAVATERGAMATAVGCAFCAPFKGFGRGTVRKMHTLQHGQYQSFCTPFTPNDKSTG